MDILSIGYELFLRLLAHGFAICAKKSGWESGRAEEWRGRESVAEAGAVRMVACFSSSVARRVKLFGWVWGSSG